MIDIPMLYFYEGKNVEELTRGELVAALKIAIQERDSMSAIWEMDRRMRKTFDAVRNRHL